MKTKHFFIYKQQPLLCTGKQLLSSLSLRLDMSLSRIAEKMNRIAKTNSSDSKTKKKLKKLLHALVVRVDAVRNSKAITKAFPRFITGLVLLVWAAPYADTFYTRLDFNDRVSADVWYYESYHWLFMCLGPYLKNLFATVGLYLIFVRKPSLIKTVVISYPLMYDAGKIIWLLLVSNHAEYKTVTPRLFLTYGFFSASFLIIMIDLLAFWLNHRVEAFKRRLKGIAQIADKAEPQVIVKSFVETMEYGKKVEQFNL